MTLRVSENSHEIVQSNSNAKKECFVICEPSVAADQGWCMTTLRYVGENIVNTDQKCESRSTWLVSKVCI